MTKTAKKPAAQNARARRAAARLTVRKATGSGALSRLLHSAGARDTTIARAPQNFRSNSSSKSIQSSKLASKPIIIKSREYVGTLVTATSATPGVPLAIMNSSFSDPGAASSQVFDVSPANKALHTRAATQASLYNMWKLRAVTVEAVANVSAFASGATTGTTRIAYNPDPTDPFVASNRYMANLHSTSFQTTQSGQLTILPAEAGGQWRYVGDNKLSDIDTLTSYSAGYIYIHNVGNPTSGVTSHDVYVNYEYELKDPVVDATSGNPVAAAVGIVTLTAGTLTSPSGSSIPFTSTDDFSVRRSSLSLTPFLTSSTYTAGNGIVEPGKPVFNLPAGLWRVTGQAQVVAQSGYLTEVAALLEIDGYLHRFATQHFHTSTDVYATTINVDYVFVLDAANTAVTPVIYGTTTTGDYSIRSEPLVGHTQFVLTCLSRGSI